MKTIKKGKKRTNKKVSFFIQAYRDKRW